MINYSNRQEPLVIKPTSLYLKGIVSLLLLIVCLSNNQLYSQGLLINKINNSIKKSGISLGAGYTGDYFSNFYGGISKKSTYLHNIDFNVTLDLQKSLGWKNATIHSHILGNQGGSPNDFVGTVQGISNITAPNTWKLYELWLEQHLFDDKLSILFGLYDLNSEFDVKEASSIFINPSHGIGPDFSLTGKNGPSIFPTTSLSLRLNYNVTDQLSFKLALLDAVPGNLNNPNGTHILLEKDDGLLFATEINYYSDNVSQSYFKYAIGAWIYSEKFESHINGLNNKFGNYGVYVFAEKFLIPFGNNENEGLIGFIRLGIAEKQINQICTYYGAGVNFIGLISGRNSDVLGIAISACQNSSDFVSTYNLLNPYSNVKNFEYIIELTYQLGIFDSIQLQPDVQYVVNPSFSLNKTAIVFGARLKLRI